MRKWISKLGPVLVACLASVSCWYGYPEYPLSRGAGKADTEVAIFRSPGFTERMVNVADGHIDYQKGYKPAHKSGKPIYGGARLVRLLPGQYKITATGWAKWTGEFDIVDLKAGHTYKIIESGNMPLFKPNRKHVWIQDITTGQRVSNILSYCYYRKDRWSGPTVPCPND